MDFRTAIVVSLILGIGWIPALGTPHLHPQAEDAARSGSDPGILQHVHGIGLDHDHHPPRDREDRDEKPARARNLDHDSTATLELPIRQRPARVERVEPRSIDSPAPLTPAGIEAAIPRQRSPVADAPSTASQPSPRRFSSLSRRGPPAPSS